MSRQASPTALLVIFCVVIFLAMVAVLMLAGILQIKPISLNMGLSEINRTIKWYPERVTAL